MERQRDGEVVELGCERRATGQLALAAVGLGGGDLLTACPQCFEVARCAGDDDGGAAVTDGDNRLGAQITVPEARAIVGEDRVDTFGGGVADRHHRSAVGGGGQSAPAGDDGPRRADQLCQGQQHTRAHSGTVVGDRLGGQHPLRVPDHRCRRDGGGVETLFGERVDGGELRKQNTGNRQSRIRKRDVGGYLIAGVVCTDPGERVEAVGPGDRQLAGHGCDQPFGGVDVLADPVLEVGVDDQFGERGQPRRTLSTETDRIRFTGGDPVRQCAGGSGTTGGSQLAGADVIDGHGFSSFGAV